MAVRTCLMVLLSAISCVTVSGAEQLRWKLSIGDVLTYNVQNTMETEAVVSGTRSRSSMTQTMRMVWKVTDRAADGSMVLSQVIQQIIVEMKPNGVDTIRFDSASRDMPDDPIVRSLGHVFNRIVDQEFVVRMAPTGRILDVRIPPGLLTALKTAAVGTPAGLDDDALRQMLAQTSVLLPADAVNIGDQWDSRQTIELPLATLEMSARMTWTGRGADGLAEIRYEPSIRLEPRDDSPVRVMLRKSSGSGQVRFDMERGRVTQMELNLNMNMETVMRGRTVNQDIQQRTVMVLDESR